MPKLLIFAPCDNVLINKDAESASLIVILSGVKFAAPPAPLPEKTMVPMRWFIFCQWLIAPEEIGVVFEQRVRFGEGLQFFDQTTEFRSDPGKYHQRVAVGIFGFPLVNKGVHNVYVDLRIKGNADWEQIQSYPLEVEHL